MKKKNNPSTFSSFKTIFEKIAYGTNHSIVFRDFLETTICVFSRNFKTGLSHMEDEYLKIIEPYKKNKTLEYFPQLLAEMINYMEEFKDSDQGNDLLGGFYEQEISMGKNGQFFTPFPICLFMAKITSDEEIRSLNVLDPCCGSGRMLMACSKNSTVRHNYYGIDIDPVCVKMTAINMFLNGLKGEVICANGLDPTDFNFGYRISFIPLSIFKIDKKEDSMLWQINQSTYAEMKKETVEKPKSPGKNPPPQLQLF